jgi:hypothetical protein
LGKSKTVGYLVVHYKLVGLSTFKVG